MHPLAWKKALSIAYFPGSLTLSSNKLIITLIHHWICGFPPRRARKRLASGSNNGGIWTVASAEVTVHCRCGCRNHLSYTWVSWEYIACRSLLVSISFGVLWLPGGVLVLFSTGVDFAAWTLDIPDRAFLRSACSLCSLRGSVLWLTYSKWKGQGQHARGTSRKQSLPVMRQQRKHQNKLQAL